ncbi:hypothetical protein C5167_028629 [Papaver somniferum]|nr:hypothetical protein C5167_028629 [Papaver somniferum]
MASARSILAEAEDSELERQLKILNKPSIKTLHAPWGDIYDCVEFHKQPAFDHPLLKNHKFLGRDETASTKPHNTLMSLGDGCPKGTVPIRRTTKEDLIRAKSFSASTTSSHAPGEEHRAGITLQVVGETFNGASGTLNAWNPTVNPDQFSSAELALKGGPQEQTSAVKFGWIVSPELYGNNKTRTFAYWTGDGGHKTGCYNTRCRGFVQVDRAHPPDMTFAETSHFPGSQVVITVEISLERETGKWWLILHPGPIKIGYWPRKLFPLFNPGAQYVYWGGRVKSGKDGSIPPMGGGVGPGGFSNANGVIGDLQYYDKNSHVLKPEKIEYTIDCKQYDSHYDNGHHAVYFGGPGGGICT